MKFEWDNQKCRANVRRHGIDFEDVIAVFDGYTITVEDRSDEYWEQRFRTLSRLKNQIIVICHTETDESIRIISARKATKRERALYVENL